MAQQFSDRQQPPDGVDVWLDEKTYRTFAVFDGLIRTKSWRRPAWFAGVFTVLALVSFLAAGSRGEGKLLGAVLLLVGLGLPASYFRRFFRMLGTRLDRLQLQRGSRRRAYFLALNAQEGTLQVTAPPAEPLVFSMTDAFGVWLRPGAIYLYVQEDKVYIVPQSCASMGLQPLWEQLKRMVPNDRLHS